MNTQTSNNAWANKVIEPLAESIRKTFEDTFYKAAQSVYDNAFRHEVTLTPSDKRYLSWHPETLLTLWHSRFGNGIATAVEFHSVPDPLRDAIRALIAMRYLKVSHSKVYGMDIIYKCKSIKTKR